MAKSGSRRRSDRPTRPAAEETREALVPRRHRRAQGRRLRRRQRPGDRPAGRLQPGPGLLPLRLGDQPAAGGARRRERDTARALSSGGRPGGRVGRVRRRRAGDLRGGSRRRPHRGAGRDDRRRLGDAGAGPRGGGADRAVARRSPPTHCAACSGLALGGCDGARRGRPCGRRALSRAGDAGAPRRGTHGGAGALRPGPPAGRLVQMLEAPDDPRRRAPRRRHDKHSRGATGARTWPSAAFPTQLRRCDGSFQLFRRGDRPRARGRRAAGAYPDRPSRACAGRPRDRRPAVGLRRRRSS